MPSATIRTIDRDPTRRLITLTLAGRLFPVFPKKRFPKCFPICILNSLSVLFAIFRLDDSDDIDNGCTGNAGNTGNTGKIGEHGRAVDSPCLDCGQKTLSNCTRKCTRNQVSMCILISLSVLFAIFALGVGGVSGVGCTGNAGNTGNAGKIGEHGRVVDSPHLD